MQMHEKFMKEQEGKFLGELQWENKTKELKRSIILFIVMSYIWITHN